MTKSMMFVQTAGHPPADMCERIALLDGVEMVYAFGGHFSHQGNVPDFVVILNNNEHAVEVAIKSMDEGVQTYSTFIDRVQPHIIGVQDIPGPLPSSGPRMRVARPIIDRVPGIETSHTAVVHRDFSSQAGLASFADIGTFTGFGSGLADMATLAD